MGNESASSVSVVALYKLTNKKIILINRKNKKKNKEKKEKKKENSKMKKKKENSKRKANVTKKQIENFFTFICNISLPAVSVTEYKGPTAMHDLATTVYR